MTTIDGEERATELFLEARRHGRKVEEVGDWLERVDQEPIPVLLRLNAKLTALADTRLLVGPIGHLIDLRVGENQVRSSEHLRTQMEMVADTLKSVEALQYRIEKVGIWIGVVGLVLAVVGIGVACVEVYAALQDREVAVTVEWPDHFSPENTGASTGAVP